MLLTGGLMLGVYTILEAGEQGWGSAQTLGLGAVSIALLAAFIVRQARIANPLMPLRLFRSRNVAGANLVMALLVVGFFGMFFLGALYLQGILGYSPLEVGLAFLPACLVMGTLSLGYAERADHGLRPADGADRGPGVLRRRAARCSRGRRSTATTWSTVLPVMLLLGAGAGTCFPALMTLAMSGATPSDSGLASGLVNTTVQVGGAIGLAVLATLASERTDALRADGESTRRRAQRRLPPRLPDRGGRVVVAIVVAVVVVRSDEHGATAEEPGARGRRADAAEPAYSEAAVGERMLDSARAREVLRRARSVPAGFVTTYGDLCPAAPRFAGAVMAACKDPKFPGSASCAPTAPWQRGRVSAGCSKPRGPRSEASGSTSSLPGSRSTTPPGLSGV